jgi:hypothetical protein
MSELGDRIDAYIGRRPEWARQYCQQLRATIRAAEPALTEVWKWNGPCYEHEGLVCSFDAAKAFVSITFFRGSEMRDAASAFNHCVNNEHNRSIRFERGDVIDEALIAAYVREAVALNLAGPKPKALPVDEKLQIPQELLGLLAQHEDARAVFDGFAPYKRRDYVDWINEAKRSETRAQRIEKTLINLKAGLGLHDKYRA